MSRYSRIFLLGLFTFAMGNVARAQCEDAKSTLQINEYFAKELKKADAEVNRIYQLTVKKLQPDDAALLRKAQRAWLAYRDAQCEAEICSLGWGHWRPSSADEL